MRILISILMFLIGAGCVVYSYIGSVVELANDAGVRANGGDEAGAVSMVIDFIMAGEIPRLSGFLYGGLLLIVMSIMYLIVFAPRKQNADQE